MMSGVMASEHVRVKRCPFEMAGRRLAAGVEGVAGRADADERLAGFDKAPDESHLVGLGCAAANAQDQQAGVFECEGTREIVRCFGVCDCHRAAQSQRLELLEGERRKGCLGLVFIFADQKDDAGAVVGLELKRGLAGQLGREDRGSDVLLDVLDHAVCAFGNG